MKKFLLLFSMVTLLGLFGANAQNPEEPTEFTINVVKNGQGKFTVNLSAKTPTQYRYSGPDIEEGTKVKMVFSKSCYDLGVSDAEVSTQEVDPGTVVTCEDTDVQTGYSYTYYCYAYVGENASWGASQYGVYIGIKPGTPSISAKTGEDGMPPVTITVIAPEKTASNADMEGPMTIKIVAAGANYYDPDVLLETFENVMPGETKVYEYTPEELSRQYSFGAIAETEDGISDRGQTSIYVGHDLPSAPQNVNAAVNEDGSVTITWEAPTTAIRGGTFVTPLYYDVTRNDGVVIVEKTESLTATDKCNDINAPTAVSYSVKVYNEDGGDQSRTSNEVIVGPAASLPFYESFSTPNGYYMKADNLWAYNNSYWEFKSYTYYYDAEPVLGDDDGMAECYFSSYSGGAFDKYPLTSSAISFEGASYPVLSFYYFPIEGAPNTIDVEILQGEKVSKLATYQVGELNEDGDLWTKVFLPLDEFAGELSLQLNIVPTGGENPYDNEYVYIDEVLIDNYPGVGDLAPVYGDGVITVRWANPSTATQTVDHFTVFVDGEAVGQQIKDNEFSFEAELDHKYSIAVQAHYPEVDAPKSEAVLVDPAGINLVSNDANVVVEYYNLQGIRIVNLQSGQSYIRKVVSVNGSVAIDKVLFVK